LYHHSEVYLSVDSLLGGPETSVGCLLYCSCENGCFIT